MKIKRIITSVLIAFVIVSIAVVIIKESKPKQQKNATTVPKATVAENKVTPNPKEENYIIVYYFHGNMRCRTCMAFEQYTKDALDEFFAKKIKEGNLIYKVVNVDDNKNEHFVSDYNLTTKSVVLAKFTYGKEEKWKNLDEIWKLVGNKEYFINYIKSEINLMVQ